MRMLIEFLLFPEVGVISDTDTIEVLAFASIKEGSIFVKGASVWYVTENSVSISKLILTSRFERDILAYIYDGENCLGLELLLCVTAQLCIIMHGT